MALTPVILAGGSGTRLWPMSRAAYPKQFLSLGGAQSLLQDTLSRASGARYDAPIIVMRCIAFIAPLRRRNWA